MDTIQRWGQRLFSQTSVGDEIYMWYNYLYALVRQRSLDTSGFYTVTSQIRNVRPFELYLPGPTGPWGTSTLYEGGVLPFVNGRYEPPIQHWLDRALDPDDTFWEVGARFGYYSIGLGQVAGSVIAFEANDEWAGYIRRSADENDLDNVDVVTGVVGEEVHLDNFDSPDVVLIDVDGGEYDALKTAQEAIRANPSWIIEVNPADYPPGELKALFRNEGYDIELSDYPPRSPSYHIFATP